MSSRTSSTKNWGLRLVVPGAPDVPHTVAGITGLYRPSEPTPVGGDGEPTLDEARAAAKGDDAPVKLEEIGPRKVETLREEQPTTIDDVVGDDQED